MLAGLALKLTVGVGAGATVTVIDFEACPPLPEQVKVNVEVPVNPEKVLLPDVGAEPVYAPEAKQVLALVDDQLNVELPP